MTGFKITLRQIQDPERLVDLQWLGEIYYDVIEGRLCICNGPDVIPYPSVNIDQGKLDIPQGYRLSGYTNNNMAGSWDTPQQWIAVNMKTGISIARIGLSDQYITPALDAVYNRTAQQSLESFHALQTDGNFTITYSTQKKTYKGVGNLWLEQTKIGKSFTGQFSLLNYGSDQHQKGIRFSNVESYNANLYPKGRTSLTTTAKSPYMTGLFLKSKMYYPNAAHQDLTFYLLYECIDVPTKFNTRIGWEGNWQVFQSVITDSNKKRGCLAFHFKAKNVLEANKSKPINIDWVYDLVCYKTPGILLQRGIHLSSLMVLPGTIPANVINPSFEDLGTLETHALMYGTPERTQYMTGREDTYVNFPIPLLNANYDVDITFTPYIVSISNKTRFGFVCRSPQASPDTRWRFRYTARL